MTDSVQARAVTFDDVAAMARTSPFPAWTLEDVNVALCCYVSEFHGRQDVIHVAKAGVPRAVLVDPHGMDEMERVYSPLFPGWQFMAKPASGVLPLDATPSDLVTFHEDTFDPVDIVTLDPWTNDMPRVWADEVPRALAIAPRVVVGYCPAAFDHDGEAEDDVRAMLPEGVRLAELLKRSSYRGGVWWAVLERDK